MATRAYSQKQTTRLRVVRDFLNFKYGSTGKEGANPFVCGEIRRRIRKSRVNRYHLTEEVFRNSVLGNSGEVFKTVQILRQMRRVPSSG